MESQEKAVQMLFESCLLDSVINFNGNGMTEGNKIYPFNFNWDSINLGSCSIMALGEAFAEAIRFSGIRYDMMFTLPKRVSWALAAKVILADYGLPTDHAFNHKGDLAGTSDISGKKALIIHDDISPILKPMREFITDQGGEVSGVLIPFDMKNKVREEKTAAQIFENENKIPVISASNLDDLMIWLESSGFCGSVQILKEIEDYRRRHCINGFCYRYEAPGNTGGFGF